MTSLLSQIQAAVEKDERDITLLINGLKLRIVELEADLLAAREDAERYRWLREGTHGMDKPFIAVLGKGYVQPFKQEQLDLDAAIDTNREANRGED